MALIDWSKQRAVHNKVYELLKSVNANLLRIDMINDMKMGSADYIVTITYQLDCHIKQVKVYIDLITGALRYEGNENAFGVDHFLLNAPEVELTLELKEKIPLQELHKFEKEDTYELPEIHHIKID